MKTVVYDFFRLAGNPSQGVLPDPYLGQSIGPMPGYGVSLHGFRT